jgi:hypothetical protein
VSLPLSSYALTFTVISYAPAATTSVAERINLDRIRATTNT